MLFTTRPVSSSVNWGLHFQSHEVVVRITGNDIPEAPDTVLRLQQILQQGGCYKRGIFLKRHPCAQQTAMEGRPLFLPGCPARHAECSRLARGII